MRRARFIRWALSFFFVGSMLVWVKLDRSPPSWDDSFYLSNSLVVYDALTEGGLRSFAAKSVALMGIKPPLIALLPTPVYLVFGRRHGVAYLVNAAALVVIFVTLYRLGKRYSSARAGLIAIYVAGTMPILYGLARWYLVETGLVAIVCVAMCLVTEWQEPLSSWRVLLIGVICGFGLLMKMSFPVYVLVPLVYLVVRERETMLRSKTALAFLVPAALVALPWYVVNARQAFALALKAGSAGAAAAYGTGEVLSIDAIKRYLVNLSNAAPPVYFLIAAALGFTLIGERRRRGLVFCALWAAPVLLLVFSHYRDLRYAAPLFPALALTLGILVDSAIEKYGSRAAAVTGMLLALPLLSMLQVSFGVLGRPLELGGMLFVAPKLSYARMYSRDSWPHGEILADIYRASNTSGGATATLILGTNSARFNADNFQLAVRQGRFPFEVSTTTYETDPGTLRSHLDSTMYFIFKEGGEPEAPTFNRLGEVAVRHVRGGARFTELPIARKLPDGGVARVYANRPPGGFQRSGAFLEYGLEAVPTRNITFADKLQLTGLSLERTPDGLEVKYRWRCLNRVDRAYWCFTHILDERGGVAGYLDHKILNGDPPTNAWSPGDTAIERLLFRFRTPQSGGFRLRLGVFDRASGDRLTITASDLPLADNRTAVVFAP